MMGATQQKVIITLDPKDDETASRKVSYRPALNDNDASRRVFDAIDELTAALRECQSKEHVPGYSLKKAV